MVGRGIALLFHDRGTRRGWVVSSTPRPHFSPGKDPVPILEGGEWAPGPVWTGGKSRPHRDSNPDRPAHSQSLYRLSYPAQSCIRSRLIKLTACMGPCYNASNTRADNVSTVTNPNSILAEIKSRLKSRNVCYHPVQNVMSSSLLSKNIKIKIYRSINFDCCFVLVWNFVSHVEGGGWVLSRIGCWEEHLGHRGTR